MLRLRGLLQSGNKGAAHGGRGSVPADPLQGAQQTLQTPLQTQAGSVHWAVRAVAYAAGLTAGVLINLETLQQGASWGLTALSVVSVFFAALGVDQGYKLWKRKEFAGCALAAGLTLCCIPLNAVNVFVVKSEVVAKQTHNRAVSGSAQGGLQAEIDTLQTLLTPALTLSGGLSSGALEKELKRLQIDALFTKSKRCEDATLPGSRKFCDAVATVEKRIEAAKTVEDIAPKLSEKRKELRAEAAKTDSDTGNPGALRIAEATGWTMEGAVLAQVAVTALAQLGIEILGPLILLITAGSVVLAAPQRQPEGITIDLTPVTIADMPVEPEALPTRETPELISPPRETVPQPKPEPKGDQELISEFVTGRMKKEKGSNVSTVDAHNAYSEACVKAGAQPLHITQFVPIVVALGFEKKRVGVMSFTNCRLVPAKGS